jgi:DNA polymerase-3 subunit epsilon
LFKELPNHKLGTLVKTFGIGETISHRAIADAEHTFQCYEYMIKHTAANGICFSELDTRRNKALAKHIAATSDEFDTAHPLYGKTCVFTGVLERMTRREAMQLVVNIGGLVADNVTKETNFLILGNNDYKASIKEGKSTKQKKAEDMKLKGKDIEIMPEKVFYDLIFLEV